MRTLFFSALLCTGLLAASACGPSTGPAPGPNGSADGGALNDGGVIQDAGPDDDGGVGDDGGTLDGGDDDGGTDAGCSDDDPLDDLGVDSNCDGAEGVAAQSIYVSNAGDDIYGGTPEFPVKTLARAAALHELDHARKYILVAASGEPYASEGLGALLSDGASVTGALFRENGWSRPQGVDTPKGSTTVVSNQRGVAAEIANLGTALAWVSLKSTQQPDAGVDTFGMVLSGPVPLRLDHVAIEVGDGAAGADGQSGADAGDNSLTFQGGSNTNDPNQPMWFGGKGGPGGTGAGVLCGALAPLAGGKGGNIGTDMNAPPPEAGAPGAAVPPNPGAAGGAAGQADPTANPPDGPGGKGEDGAAGAEGAPALAAIADAWEFGPDGSVIVFPEAGGAAAGELGGGGGGGGGAELHWIAPTSYGGGGAGGGAGGCPGTGGGNGALGGFSVGIVSSGSWPTFNDVTVSTGNGGNGGAAGEGGHGGLGGLGGVATGPSLFGGNGGAGGPGGNGGAGAPGNGGWSIGVLAVKPLTTPEDLGDVTITLGAPGAAGAPATHGNPGFSGSAVATKDR